MKSQILLAAVLAALFLGPVMGQEVPDEKTTSGNGASSSVTDSQSCPPPSPEEIKQEEKSGGVIVKSEVKNQTIIYSVPLPQKSGGGKKKLKKWDGPTKRWVNVEDEKILQAAKEFSADGDASLAEKISTLESKLVVLGSASLNSEQKNNPPVGGKEKKMLPVWFMVSIVVVLVSIPIVLCLRLGTRYLPRNDNHDKVTATAMEKIIDAGGNIRVETDYRGSLLTVSTPKRVPDLPSYSQPSGITISPVFNNTPQAPQPNTPTPPASPIPNP